MMIKSLNKTLLLTMVLIASQSILAQEKNPLDNIDVTKAMMHLDWASMS